MKNTVSNNQENNLNRIIGLKFEILILIEEYWCSFEKKDVQYFENGKQN